MIVVNRFFTRNWLRLAIPIGLLLVDLFSYSSVCHFHLYALAILGSLPTMRWSVTMVFHSFKVTLVIVFYVILSLPKSDDTLEKHDQLVMDYVFLSLVTNTNIIRIDSVATYYCSVYV